MNSNEPKLLDTFTYNGKQIEVEWFEVDNVDQLPVVGWQQVYAVCNLDGQVPVVLYDNARVNLPGGHTESRESIEQTLKRELDEELNCRVLSWHPIGYQRLTEPGDRDVVFQLRVYAEVEKNGEFSGDVGGSVIGYKLISLQELNREIGYGKVGDRIIDIVSSEYL